MKYYSENKTVLSFQIENSFRLQLGRKIHHYKIMWQGSNMTKALSPGITHHWLTLACVVQLSLLVL